MPRTRRPISNNQKAALRAQHHLKPYLSNLQLQQWFEAKYNQPINPSSISRILSVKYTDLDSLSNERLLNDKRRRPEQWPDLEHALFSWIQRAEERITISQEVIREKARQFWPALYPGKDMPTFSNGWLRGFQARRDVKFRVQHGEAGSLGENAAIEMLAIQQALSTYAPQDIFNCDETSLYWRLVPDRSLTTRTLPGRKKEKSRISALFCCNYDASERLPIWFIGTAKRPKAFATAGINIENLGCVWRSNKKAWMTTDIFKEWLLWFDNKMNADGRKVALLMDNFSAHESAFKELGFQLQNTFIIWLPANSTTRYQPLDQGIIYTWKSYWKKQWVLYMMAQFDQGFDPMSTITILDAIRWAIAAWDIDLSTETIHNCFKKALFLDESVQPLHNQELIKEVERGLQRLELANNIQQAMDINQFLNPADEQVDDDLMSIDDAILCQFSQENEDQEEDDNGHVLPQILAPEALESLYKLQLHEEQQVEANQDLIQLLRRHERVLLGRKQEKQQQVDIRHYFQ